MTHHDTHPEAARVQLELLRRATVTQRLERALAMSQLTIDLSRRAIRKSMPEAGERDVRLRFVELHYGKELAQRVRRFFEARDNTG